MSEVSATMSSRSSGPTVSTAGLSSPSGSVVAGKLSVRICVGPYSVPQPVFGIVVDRLRVGWMAGAGVGLAELGLSLSGIVPGYAGVWCMILLSGLGVAMFHPAAGKAARENAGTARRR